MHMYFITGNQGKLAEAKDLIPGIEGLDIDLPEIQELDAKKVIEAKIKAAFNHIQGELIVEDTSLYYEGLKGLPGPLIKWFLETIGTEGLYKMALAFNTSRASAKTIIGYAKSPKDIHFFVGEIKGQIVEPRGDKGFGFDSIFQPQGYNQTFAEMELVEKNKLSMRKIAFSQLADFLKK